MTNFQKPLGGSFNARPADPTPVTEPEAEAKPNEGTPQPSYSGPKQYPPSAGRQDTLPVFSKFGKTLALELERDRKEREAVANEALGIDPELQQARVDRARIAALTQSGEITEARANELWRNLHPNLSPEDVR